MILKGIYTASNSSLSQLNELLGDKLTWLKAQESTDLSVCKKVNMPHEIQPDHIMPFTEWIYQRKEHWHFISFSKATVIMRLLGWCPKLDAREQLTSQSLDVLPSVSKLSSCNGVNLLQVPKRIRKTENTETALSLWNYNQTCS